MLVSPSLLALLLALRATQGFNVVSHRTTLCGKSGVILSAVEKASNLEDNPLQNDDEKEVKPAESASTGTVNERLMAELQQASDKEKFGPKSAMGEKMGLSSFQSTKTDEERQAAIDQARDLNGVNPIVAITGSLFALAGAAGLWALTQFLAEYFAMHPVVSDVYFVERVTSVFRNVVMGLVSLASGFFGVTGMGIFLLGVRVAYGVAKGELDPTPIVKKETKSKEVDMGSVWELMTNKNQKRGRR